MHRPRSDKICEDSISLRVITSLMSLVGILAASQLAESPLWISTFGIDGVIFGSWLSYLRRRKNNGIIKIWISLGILFVAAAFFRELLTRINLNIADARIPLTNMLIALQGLHCFDLPRRRDLSLSGLVGLVLLASAATLSRDMVFAIYLGAFLALSVYMFRTDCTSRTLTRAESLSGTTLLLALKQPNKPFLQQKIFQLALPGIFFVAASLICFAILPKIETGNLRNIRVSTGLNLAFLGKDTAFAQALSNFISPDGSVKSNPKAYYGFSEQLDTSFRTNLGNQVVMHVSCPVADYWRGMAFDTFDGIYWTMSKSKKVITRYAEGGQMIQVAPLPNFSFSGLEENSLTQVFYLEEDASNLVVCAAVPNQIYFPSNSLDIDMYGSIRSPVGIQKDMVYTVRSMKPVFDVHRLRLLPEESPRMKNRIKRRYANYLQIPKIIDQKVIDRATFVAGSGNYFQKAERLKNFIQANYAYDLNVPPSPKGMDSVSDFLLHKRRGYCEMFASSLAIMCRSQDIPTRLVTGYSSGEYNPFTGLWEVRLNDAHCWTEVFIPSCGWVPFDPSPVGAALSNRLESHSVFDYIKIEFSKSLNMFMRLPAIKTAIGVLLSNLQFCSELLARIYARAGWALAAGIALCAYLTLRKLLRFKFPFRNKTKEKARFSFSATHKDKTHKGATLAYQQMLNGLESLGIRRELNDTGFDLLKKVRLKLTDRNSTVFAKPEKDRLLQQLEIFLDSYAETRFGKNQIEIDNLCRSAKELATEFRDLAQVNKKKTV